MRYYNNPAVFIVEALRSFAFALAISGAIVSVLALFGCASAPMTEDHARDLAMWCQQHGMTVSITRENGVVKSVECDL